MLRSGTLLIGMMLAAGGLAATAPSAAAGNPGIAVYTWTDAKGITHFSDKPRARGPAKKLVLPTPPPPDRTAIAADRAWVRRMDREARADAARIERRAEQQRHTEAVAEQQQSPAREQMQYLPIYFPARRHHWHGRHGGGRSAKLPSARFPSSALPSSFPEEPSFWPPRP